MGCAKGQSRPAANESREVLKHRTRTDMKRTIALGSFEITRFVPEIKRRRSHRVFQPCKTGAKHSPAKTMRAVGASTKSLCHTVAALRRSWRAMAQVPP